MKFPGEGEVVVGTILRVEHYGFYVVLDEYGNMEGFVPGKEIPSNMARNIMSYFKPKQKIILKVTYANLQKMQVDLTLKRVTNDERRKKLLQYKQEVTAAKVLDLAKAKVGLKDDSKLREAFLRSYGGLYRALVSIFEEPGKAAEELKGIKEIDQKLAEAYLKTAAEIAREKLRPRRVSVGGVAKVYSMAPNGIQVVKDALGKAAEEAEGRGAELSITYGGSPRYMIKVTAGDYKSAEGALASFLELAEGNLKGKSHFEFERIKR